MSAAAQADASPAGAGRGAVLGLDTATAVTAVAVTRGGEALFEHDVDPVPGGRPRHATSLLAGIDAGVEAAGGWDAVEVVAVGVGPGSFTGLRVGVATARALAQARGLPLAPVGSLAAIAAAVGEHRWAAGRPRLALIDARRRELFAALFDPAGEPAWEPFVAGPEEVASRLSALESGPLAAGDGALRFRQELVSAGADVPDEDDPVHRLAARHLCRLAERSVPVGPAEVEPVYLRRPDAEVWRERIRDGSTERT